MTAIRVELQLADGSFTSGMLRAGQSLESFNRQLIKSNPALSQIAANGGSVVKSMNLAQGSTRGFLATLRDVSIVAGVLSMGISKLSNATNSWVGDIVRVNAEMERLRYQMEGMSRSANPLKDAANNVDYLRNMAARVPFSLQTLTNGFVKLKATGTDPLAGSLKAISDGVAAFGGTDENFNRIVLGISQMSGKGVIQMEEMRQQLAEHMPRAMELMARSMGISMGELVDVISTGRLAAKPALEGFFAEIERTFGGRAEYMMESFSGQMSKLVTSLQILVTGEGGSSFFNAIKSQLVDLNDFLASDVAKLLAQDIGLMMASTVSALRTGIEWVVEFRSELGRLATFIATGFGLHIAIAGIRSLTQAVQGSVLAVRAASVNLAQATTWFQGVGQGLTSLATAGTAAQMGIRGIGASLIAVGGMASAAMPLLAGLGMAVWAAGEYFGWFTDRVDEAYVSLKRYGAESRQQASDIIDAQLSKLKAQQEDLIARRDQRVEELLGSDHSNAAERVAEQLNEKIRLLGEQIEEVEASRERLEKTAAEREDATLMRDLNRVVDERRRSIKRAYDDENAALEENYRQQLELVGKGERSMADVQEEYQKSLANARIRLSEQELDFYRERTAEVSKLMETANEDERRRYQQHLDDLTASRALALQQLNTAKSSTFGPTLLDKIPDEGKAVARAQREIDSMSDAVTKMTADLKGASGAYAEMQQRIDRGDFGTVKEGGEEVRKLHEKLLQLARDKELFDRLLKGQNKANQDIDSARNKLLEEQLELREKLLGRELTEGERIKFRLDNGFYEGLGPTEKIRKSLSDIIEAFNGQGRAASQIGVVIRENAFGAASVDAVNTVNSAIIELTRSTNGLGDAIGRVSFDGLGNSLGSLTSTMTASMQNLPKEVSDRMQLAMNHLMGKGWSKTVAAGIVGNLVAESNMNPAAIGDNGNAFGLAQWNDRGPAMKKFLAARGLPWDDFAGQLDFIDHELRTSEKRAGQAVLGARSPLEAANLIMDLYERPAEWAKVKSGNVRRGAAQRAFDSAMGSVVPASSPIPMGSFDVADIPSYEPVIDNLSELVADRERASQAIIQEAEKLAEAETKINMPLREEVLRKDYLDDLVERTKNASSNIDELGSNYQKLVDDISRGKLGSNTDVNAPEYQKLLEAAKELDRVEKGMAETRKASREADSQFKQLEEQRLELNRQIAEQRKLAQNPDYKGDSAAYQKLNDDLNEYLANVQRLHGQESDAYKQALQVKQNMLQSQLMLETTTKQAAFARERQDFQHSMMTQTQLRHVNMQKELAAIDQWIEKARQAGMDEVQIVEEAERQKAAIRAKYAAEANPMTKQMQQWADLQGNIAQASTRWMDSLAGGLTDLIMGTGDLKSVINGILRDMLNMGIKYLMSGMKGGMGGKGGGGGKALSGGKKLFGMAHSGGVVGAGLQRKFASSLAFINAPKFHTGGIVGSRLRRDEVPIIAKKGEGVFTPEQMEAMGGFQAGNSFQISAPITVNGSAGTPEQNADLAKQMARQLEGTMRGVVADEMRKQARPGNFLNTRAR